MEKKYGFMWEMNHELKKPKVTPTRFDHLVEEVEDTLQSIYNWTGNLILDRMTQSVKIRIDPWDTWSMDNTLAPIIHAMLVQLKETNHGAPFVENEYVPESLQATPEMLKAYYENGTADELHFERWNWVMDEMIWSFEQKDKDNWEEQYYRYEDDPTAIFGMKIVWQDNVGRQAHQERMSNGFRLFGRFYENLWD
jgi:hypothetical protein